MANIDPKILMEMLSKNGGVDKRAVNSAIKGDPSALLGSLSSEDRKKINSILSDKTALTGLLRDEKTQKLINEIMGKK